ncbi:hypothetical protein X777_02304 [Ooceraea biroi]|uniref:Uncharacterized protein n=1 Tax=Ooceraea biroi TaxID=2015173 RepID=A0A026WKZ3_OOCBI|nr:hypothetical protein X777_02304 [Ooceraea biroi]
MPTFRTPSRAVADLCTDPQRPQERRRGRNDVRKMERDFDYPRPSRSDPTQPQERSIGHSRCAQTATPDPTYDRRVLGAPRALPPVSVLTWRGIYDLLTKFVSKKKDKQ